MLRIVRDRLIRHPHWTALAVLLIGLLVPFVTRRNSDFEQVYVPAAQRLLNGENLIQTGYLYPPIGAWLCIPFTYLPHIPLRLAWYLVNVAALIVLLHGAWRLSGGSANLPIEKAERRRELLIMALGVGCGLPFCLDALTNQQNDLVIGALVVGGCMLVRAGRAWSAASLYGLAAAVKCTPLLWGPYLAWRGQWGPAVWVFAVAVGLNLIPDVTHPRPDQSSHLVVWVDTLIAPMAGRDYVPGQWGSAIGFNHSLAGLSNRTLLSGREQINGSIVVRERADRPANSAVKGIALGVGIGLSVLGLVCAIQRRRTAPLSVNAEGREFSLIVLLMLFLSPMSSKPHFCTLVLPGYCLARLALQEASRTAQVFLGIALFLVVGCNKDLVGGYLYDLLLWYGAVVVATLSLYLGCCFTPAFPNRRVEDQIVPFPYAGTRTVPRSLSA